MISAAEITNVDAIHPGYGLLSENANFAEVCESSHIKFIGPPPEVIRLMGEKEKARQAMKKARRADLAGIGRRDCQRRRSARVGDADRLPGDCESICRRRRTRHARRSAVNQNWKARLTRRNLKRRRHSATAISTWRNLSSGRATSSSRFWATQHGRVVSLGERECSIQRRHQKLLEESPSTRVTPEMRDRDRQGTGRVAL